MKFISNVVWLALGGLLTAILYWIVGCILLMTIIGIPFGIQLLKIGKFALWPFGHDLISTTNTPSCLQIFFNVIWFLLGWWEVALTHLIFGLLLCCTIIGIPWGLQHFKLAIGSLLPFGKEIV